ncbi:MAG: agmatine deiminase family protein [Gemmatales bacterium]|nr:agmatine deiminase family protein [Gemmatales bacterium]MDW7995760.1 agmatine deiminase family protein [Gemmatales bacterium]
MNAETAPKSAYRWPAEWEEHAATWVAWPHNENDWPGKYAPIPWIYIEILRWLAYSEKVHVLVPSESCRKAAERMLQQSHVSADNIVFHIVATNRSWVRDYAPIFVKDRSGNKIALKWRFNGWAMYSDWQQDNAAGLRIGELSRVPLITVTNQGKEIVLEGGAIESNGRGIVMTTEQCLLSTIQQRNPGYTRQDYEDLFARWFGASQVIWLAGGISGDDTHGHIDDVARFVSERTVTLVKPHKYNQADFSVYRENLRRLQQVSFSGGPINVVELPSPEVRKFSGQVLPASYANFYIANRVVLVPIFHDPADRVALNILADLFPNREVVGIYCGDLVLGLGALHCLTMQEPI